MDKDPQRNRSHRFSLLVGSAISGTSCRIHHGRTVRALSPSVASIGAGLLLLVFGCGYRNTPEARGSVAAALASTRSGEARLVGAPHLRPTPPGSSRARSAAVRRAIAATSADLPQGSAQGFWDAGVAQLLAGETD